MKAPEWRLDVDRWPGPDRLKWSISRDIVTPSPNGRFACVLYSCHEIRLQCDAGLLAILEGPPDRPTLLLQPPGFTCLDFSPHRSSAQWLAQGQVVMVLSYLYSSQYNQVSLVAFTFLEVVNRTFAHHREGAFEYAGREFIEIDGKWIIRLPPEQGAPQ
jgi:hypothetical protein